MSRTRPTVSLPSYQDVPAVASFNTAESELEAVRAGIGIGQLIWYMVERDLAAGRLVQLLPQTVTYNNGIFMYYQQRTQMPLRVRHFIDFVAEPGRQLFTPYKRSAAHRSA